MFHVYIVLQTGGGVRLDVIMDYLIRISDDSLERETRVTSNTFLLIFVFRIS